MTIAVNQPEKIKAAEGQRVEFKSSAFYAPGEHNPGFRQMRTIAETVAAFMNADGGELFIGIADDGTIRGIDGDLDVLATMQSSVVLALPSMNDATFPYKANVDHYRLKLQHILQAFLSPNHAQLYEIGFGRLGKTSQKLCCRIAVKKCAEDDFVYCSEKYSPGKPVVDEIFVRIGNEKKMLLGKERDNFVRSRWEKSMFVKLAGMRADNPSVMTEELLSGIKKLIEDRRVGIKVVVEGGQPLTMDGLGPMKSPGGLVFDGKHAGDVKTWKECYQKLCRKLNEIDAAKFDCLPDDKFFSKWFKREEPKLPGQKRAKKCMGCYPDKFGSRPDVRAMEVSGKAYFCDEDKVVHRLLAHFEIDATRFAVRPR
jgi:hypothetical protein